MVARLTQNDYETLARTVYGEARGLNEEEQRRVIGAILNRAADGHGGQTTVAGVCRAPKQFSCWNSNDPNYKQIGPNGVIRDPAAMQRIYDLVGNIFSEIADGSYQDLSGGARYYHTPGVNPPWNRNMVVTVRSGNHIFFRKPDQPPSFLQKARNVLSAFPGGSAVQNVLGSVHEFIKRNYDHILYMWGGKNKNGPGLDCSGFVKSLYRDLFRVEIAYPARDQARSIAEKFAGRGVTLARKHASQITAADIPPSATISIRRANGGGHVLQVTLDENGEPVVWDSRGGSRNTRGNLGKGVTEGSLEQLVRRLRSEGGAIIEIANVTPLFKDMKNGHAVAMNQQMFINAWQADLETKQRIMSQTVQEAGLSGANVFLNFTNNLGPYALVNRSTFIADPGTGQRILHVAAGMSENWSKFSVITHLARDQGIDPRTAMIRAAHANPEFAAWLQKPELQKMNYGPGSVPPPASPNSYAQDRDDTLRQAGGNGQNVSFANGGQPISAGRLPINEIHQVMEKGFELAKTLDKETKDYFDRHPNLAMVPRTGNAELDKELMHLVLSRHEGEVTFVPISMSQGATAQSVAKQIVGHARVSVLEQNATAMNSGNVTQLFGRNDSNQLGA